MEMEMGMVEAANLEVVQRLYASMAGADPDALRELLTEDVEFVVPGPAGCGAAGIWRGIAGVRECLDRLRGAQRNQSVEFLDFVADGSHVVVRLQVRGQVLATGKPFELSIVHFFKFRAGKVAVLLDFFDTAALAAAYEPGGAGRAQKPA